MPALLSWIVFLPLLALPLAALLPAQGKKAAWLTVAATGLQAGLCVWAFVGFQAKGGSLAEQGAYQLVERLEWIRLSLFSDLRLSIDYFVGVDGLSIALLLLSGLVLFAGAISSLTIDRLPKGYFPLYLLLSAAVPGCFVALDFFLFYLFFEFMLLPMYFLVGIWGGERREYAALKFFLYTLVGSLLILVVMVGLYLSYTAPQGAFGYHTFSLPAMTNPDNLAPDALLGPDAEAIGGLSLRSWAFLLVLLGFGIKLPVVPFHTWLPDAHVEAPTPISVVLAGILLKIGGYGLVRIGMAIFPVEFQEWQVLIASLGVISILYGGLNALAQTDLKKLVAYSSVAHMGFVLVGLASLQPEGVAGALFQMVSHGFIASMLFLLVGVLYDRTGSRTIEDYQGLAAKMPGYALLAAVGFFASLGMPGFSGFVGELFTLLGHFRAANDHYLLLGILAVLGILLAAGYHLWPFRKMFFGKLWVKGGHDWEARLSDLNAREVFLLGALALLILYFGLFPHRLMGAMTPTVAELLRLFPH